MRAIQKVTWEMRELQAERRGDSGRSENLRSVLK